MRKMLVGLAALTLCVFSLLAQADSVTTKTYNKLTEAQEQMGANDIKGAVATLTELLGNVKDDSIDKALTLQMLGYAEMGDEQFDKAIVHLKEALALDKLPEQVKYNVGYMVAQLHAAQGEFDEALEFASSWFKTLDDPSASQMMFMANIYAQTKRYEEAIPYAERAIASQEQPRESWYQLVTASYFELRRYREAATTLQRMIVAWPEKSGYWEQLASVYVVLEDEALALATLRLAWLGGYLEKEASVKSMVQLAVSRGIPEHAARMLEAGFGSKILPRDEDYVDMLANAWVAAREYDKAVTAFAELTELTQSGDPMIRVANLHVERGRWDSAESALEIALDKGLKEPGKAWLLLGIAYAEQQKFKASFEALRKARAFEDTKRQASKWLSYAEDMRKQYEWQQNYRS